MLKFKDIVRYICATVLYLYKYIKDLLRMDSVYDCARPFMLLGGIFGLGGSMIREIDGVRSVRNTRLSLIIAVFISLVITPYFFIVYGRKLFSGVQRSLADNTLLIIFVGRYVFVLSTAAMTCIRTHIYCKNLTKVLQILNNTDMMLKQENIHVNYWRIVLKTLLFGLISCNYHELELTLHNILLYISPFLTGTFIVKLLIDISCEIYFMWLILFMLIIRERFVGLNKILLQNAQVPSIIQDYSLLRRISLVRDIHEQLSEAIELFSDRSRFIIISVLVPGILLSISFAIHAASAWSEIVFPEGVVYSALDYIITFLYYVYMIVFPSMKTVVLTAVSEGHKNNRRVLTARLRRLISREEDPRTVHQLKQYILFNHDTVAGLVDLQLADVDLTLLFTVIDILVSYVFVIHSYYRISIQGETM